jgi:hypothetical protein
LIYFLENVQVFEYGKVFCFGARERYFREGLFFSLLPPTSCLKVHAKEGVQPYCLFIT